jgi:uncharacterized membrane protein
MYLSVEMEPGKKTIEPVREKQRLPALVITLIISIVMILVGITLGFVFYFKITLIALFVIGIALALFVKAKNLTFLAEEYDQDIPAQEFYRNQKETDQH